MAKWLPARGYAGRQDQPQKSYFYLSSFVFRAFNIDAQIKAFL